MSNCVNWSFLLRLMTAFTVAWPPLRAAGTRRGSHSLTLISRRESCTGNENTFPNKNKAYKFEFLFPGSCLSPLWTSPRAKSASCTSRDSNSSPPIWGWGSSTSQTLRPRRPGYCLNLNLNIQSKYIYCGNRWFFLKKSNFCRVVSCGDRLKTAMGVAVDPAGEQLNKIRILNIFTYLLSSFSGNILVANQSSGKVELFNPQGCYVKSLNTPKLEVWEKKPMFFLN